MSAKLQLNQYIYIIYMYVHIYNYFCMYIYIYIYIYILWCVYSQSYSVINTDVTGTRAAVYLPLFAFHAERHGRSDRRKAETLNMSFVLHSSGAGFMEVTMLHSSGAGFMEFTIKWKNCRHGNEKHVKTTFARTRTCT